ncbi:hypothetical protein AGMMS49975_11380 [Clostridia bacterium]|nr:hypothetical protein AGMMS49975_11380 [Clostridia bacterium]
MYEIFDVSMCKPLGYVTTGARKKEWIELDGKPWLFKEAKNPETFEFVVEKIAYELTKPLGLSHAVTELALYNGRIGSISQSVLADRQGWKLLEFKNLVKAEFGFRTDSDNTWYKDHSMTYNTKMIKDVMNSIKPKIFDSFVQAMLFDFLISNSDRHHSNWGVLRNLRFGEKEFCPLYDSGSGLFSTVPKSTVVKMLASKNIRDYITGAKSMVRYGNSDTTNFKTLLDGLAKDCYGIAKLFALEINKHWTDDFLHDIVYGVGNLVTDERKILMLKLLINSKAVLFKSCGIMTVFSEVRV